MPCFEVRTMSVEFKADHTDLLEKALDVLGWSRIVRGNLWTVGPVGQSMSIDLDNERATIQEGQHGLLNELKRAYSMQVVKKAAQLNKWQAVTTKATKGTFVRSYF